MAIDTAELTRTDAKVADLNTITTIEGQPLRGEICQLDKTGDVKTMWDPTNPDEVDHAKKTFDELKKKGFSAFAVKKSGEPGQAIKEFDPALGRIIMAPQMQGG